MKKLLGFALALTMGVTCTAALAGCDSCGSASEEDKATLAKAMTSIRTLVINKYDGKETTSLDLYGEVKVDGENYKVTWDLSSTDSNISNYIKLGEMNATTKLIDVSITRPETAVEYTMKATIKVGGASDSASFTATIPAGMKEGDGTEANPYSVSQAFAIASAMPEKLKYEDSDNPTRVCVTGYVVDCGNSSNASRAGFVKIAETATADKADWFTILSINYGDVLTSFDDLAIGAKITVSGYLMNYKKDANTAAQPEMTYFGSNGITCVALEKVVKTDAQKVADALAKVNIPTTVTGNITLPTVDGVTITMVSDNTAVIDNNGTVVRPEAGEADATVKLTVTATCGDASDIKEVTVTVKAKVATVPGQDSEATLDLAGNFSTYASDWASSYAAHEVTFADLGASISGKVEFSSANKQQAGNTIDNMPVVAAKSGSQYVTITVEDGSISAVEFDLAQWGSKTFADIHIEYTTDGTTWTTCSSVITTPGKLTSTEIPAGVTKVRLVMTDSSGKNTQVGISSIKLTVA